MKRTVDGWLTDDPLEFPDLLWVHSPEGHPGYLSLKEVFADVPPRAHVRITIEYDCE
jgi:hypothetical protein